MEEIIVTISVLLFASCIMAYYSLHLRFIALRNQCNQLIDKMQMQIDETQTWQDEHIQFSRMGKAGQEIRQENAEMRQAALNEGRDLIAKEGANIATKEGREKLMAMTKNLAMKYPKVAEGVARTLNREFGISQRLGIPEGTLLEGVAKMVLEAPAAQSNENGWNF